MVLCRILLACLIVVAVAGAPVASVLACAQSSATAATDDCHGKGAKHHSDCPGDGSKCCTLVATIATKPSVSMGTAAAAQPTAVQEPSDWLPSPHLPPPRS